MKIFIAHSSDFDYSKKLYQPLRRSKLNDEHQILLPQENGKQVITKEMIKGVDLLVSEVSCPSTGQGIELGWADLLGTPIVCISEKGAKISTSLHNVTDVFMTYDNTGDMINQLEAFLNDLNQ